jgi:serine/threonine-protein kinase HipA
MEGLIEVHADWSAGEPAQRLGTLHVRQGRTGEQLSAAYDMNPVPGSSGLALNIDESDNALDLALARSVAPYFRITDTAARSTIEGFATAVRRWDEVATSLGIKRSERDEMADAFRASLKA